MSVQGPSAVPGRFPELRPSRQSSGAAAPESKTPVTAAREHSLWEVLTEEERSFFSQQAALGTLTYGKPRSDGTPSAPTGQRLDVRA